MSSNQLVYAQGYIIHQGKLIEKLGSQGVRRFDGRLGLFKIAEQAYEWAKAEGHDAYQLRKLDPVVGFQQTRPIGCMMMLTKEICHG